MNCPAAGLSLLAFLIDKIAKSPQFPFSVIPVIKHFGWNPMWFGVMMTVNLAIGTGTLPVALNLHLAANLAKISLERISRAAGPSILPLIGSLMIVTYVPTVSLWLPFLFGLR